MSVEARPRLDRDTRREAILDVAAEVFLEAGYSAASMSMIAARLGGSKGTLYNYFRSKEELFEAYIARHCAWQLETMDRIYSLGGDVRVALMELGRLLLRLVLSDFGLRNFILVVSEGGRAADVGRLFYAAGPMRGVGRLADFIARSAEEGRLRACDPQVAAHQFIGLCQHRLFKARLCNAVPEPTEAEIETEVAAAVETFMAAYAPIVRLHQDLDIDAPPG
jgi:AcrR family transcriptional regulator